MKIKDKEKPKAPPVEPGVYMAVCVGVIDLGEQYSERFKHYAPKVKFVWELAGETVEVDGEVKPRQLSREFTFSSNKKGALRGFLGSWNGKNYSDEEAKELDLLDQLGKACQLQVILSESGEYANVDSVMALPRGIPAPVAQSPLVAWDMDQWTEEGFAALPEWVQEQIKKSTQYQKLHAPTDAVAVADREAADETGAADTDFALTNSQGDGAGGRQSLPERMNAFPTGRDERMKAIYGEKAGMTDARDMELAPTTRCPI